MQDTSTSNTADLFDPADTSSNAADDVPVDDLGEAWNGADPMAPVIPPPPPVEESLADAPADPAAAALLEPLPPEALGEPEILPEPASLDAFLAAADAGPLLLGGLILAAILYYMLRQRSEGADAQLSSSGDADRYALASAATDDLFRHRVLALAREPYRAKAPELGLDFGLLVAASRKFEAYDRLLGWLILAASAAALLILPAVAAAVTILLAAVAKQADRRSRLVAPFRKGTFSLEEAREKFGVEDPQEEANLLCYGINDPFVGLGQWVESWTVPVDTAKPAERGRSPEPIEAEEVHAAIDAAIAKLGLRRLELRDAVFVAGTEVGRFPDLLPDRFAPPRPVVSPELAARFRGADDYAARFYRWAIVTDWDGDLVYSYLYRCVRQGEVISTEMARLSLRRVADEYRGIDRVRRLGPLSALRWLIGAVLRSPMVVLAALAVPLVHVGALAASLGERLVERREVRENPMYNYGARISIREMMARGTFPITFQTIDEGLYGQMFNRQILTALVELFSAKGIDTSSLEAQAATVVTNNTFIGNKGTVVQNSAVTGNVAGARSRIGAGRAPSTAAGRGKGR